MMRSKTFALFTLTIAASVAVVGTTATGCKGVTSNDDESATNKNATNEDGGTDGTEEGGDGATDPTVMPTVIDPQLVGSWSLVATGAATKTTYYDDGTWSGVVVFRGSISDLDVARRGNYRAENGRIYYSNAESQTSKDQGETWSGWAPAATPSWEELYVIGTDENGEYLIAQEDEITEDSVKYRRSSE